MIEYSPIAKPLIDTFRNPLLEFVKDIKDEAKYFLDSGLPSYITSQYNKYNFTKTFIHRLEPIEFKKIYFPVTLNLGNKTLKLQDDVWDLFKKSNYVGIVGIAGSGKSMLMKYLFLNTVETYIKIPIVIELRNLNDFKEELTAYIYKEIFNNKLSPNAKIIERLLESGSFLILLDGYDEINSDRKNKLTTEIDQFIDRYSKNYYVISSRPGAGLESIPRLSCYNVQDLNSTEIEEFIKLQVENDDLQRDKIIQTIALPENRDYRSYLKNPLLLSMFILTFETYPQLPKNKSTFYWNVFDTLCTRHDSITKKGVYQHERKTKLLNDELEEIIRYLSYISYFEGKLSFDHKYFHKKLQEITKSLELKLKIEDLIYDLTVAISIIIVDGLEYKLPHKSLQEYFAASLISEQSDVNKRIIYTEKLLKQLSNVFEVDFNFWNLCYEMDKSCFIYNFLLHNLYNLNLKPNNKFKNILSIVSTNNTRVNFIGDHNSKTIRMKSVTRDGNIISHILKYYDIKIVVLNPKVKSSTLYKLYEKVQYSKYFVKVKNKTLPESEFEISISFSNPAIWKMKEFKQVFSEFGIIDFYEEQSKEIMQVIDRLERELEHDTAIKAGLLKL